MRGLRLKFMSGEKLGSELRVRRRLAIFFLIALISKRELDGRQHRPGGSHSQHGEMNGRSRIGVHELQKLDGVRTS